MKHLVLLCFAFVICCNIFAQRKENFTTDDYVRALKDATDIMVNDVTSPVAASRYYAYITLAANEAFGATSKQQPRFGDKLKKFQQPIIADSLVKKCDQSLAVILTLYKSARKLLPSGYLMDKRIDSLKTVATKKKIAVSRIDGSIALADKIVEQIFAYSAADGFRRLSGLRRYTPKAGDAYWQPTAPGFMAAIEPNWNTLRTFVMDSCSQFAGAPPNEYNVDTSSAYFKELREVYTIGKKRDSGEAAIAMFWDCNPFALQQVGHLEFGLKKISPGGHWMGITGIASRKRNLSLSQTAYVHTLVAVGMADAFIACWDTKYRYNRVRPETAIKRLIDPSWLPLLQTPPFPEYTSGHSVISTAASIILTQLFGDNFSYADDTEVEFGLPVRNFTSFRAASAEAAISRLYGGIHYRDAIVHGVGEGEHIGELVIARCDVQPINTSNKHISVHRGRKK